MIFFSKRSGVVRAPSLLGLLAIVILCSGASAAIHTWDGGGADNDLKTAGNWSLDETFDTTNSASNTDSLVIFTGSIRTTTYVSDAAAVCLNGVTFDAGASAFTIGEQTPGAQSLRFGPTDNTTRANTLRTVQNDSPNVQTFDVKTYGSRVDINANTADFVFNRSYNVATAASATQVTQLLGSHDIYLNAGIGGVSAATDSTSGQVRIAGPGTTFITAPSVSADSGNIGGYWNGRIEITGGILRISDDRALGAGYADSTSAGRTQIGTAATHTGRLELVGDGDGSITTSDRMVVFGRPNYATAAAHIKNVNGTNTLSGQIINNGAAGDATVIEAGDDGIGAAESLTLGDALAPSNIKANIAGTTKLVLRGNGAGLINDAIINHEDNTRFWDLYKLDGGTWTIASGINTYTGKTVIEGGTLALSGAGSITTSSGIEVKTGATFDVSAVSSSPYTLASAQTLSGTGAVNGHLANGGATIVPGTLTTAGTLEFNNNLTISTGALKYNLANVTTVGAGVNDLISVGGNLTLNSGVTIDVSLLNTTLAGGDYQLINYTGSYSHDYPDGSINSYVTVTGLSGGSTRQTHELRDNTAHQIVLHIAGTPMSLTWAGNGTDNNWDLITTQDWNAGTKEFYNDDQVTFTDSGSNFPAVNLVGDLAPGSITVTNTSKDYAFAGTGAIVGSSGLTKNGTGKLTIENSGVNTFSGTINLNAGTLAFNRADNITVANTLSGSGTLEQQGAGIVELTGTASTFSGPVTVTGGTLRVTNSLGTAAALPDVTDNATLQLGGTANVTFARRITGSGNVEKVDTNAIVLTSDNNDYAGTTTITAGILSVGNGGTTGALGGTGDITLGATGTLQFNRQGTVNVSRNIAGTGATANAVQYGTSVDLNGAVFNVSGHNTYSGDTTVQEGTVVLSTDDGLGDTSGETVILGGSGNYATVALTGGITVAENFTIGPRGAGAIVASGYVPHIESVSGSNTLSGTIDTGSLAGGSVYTIRSAGTGVGDLLTISGNVNASQTGSRSLWLRGPGAAVVTGGLTGSWSSVSFADGGVWTFSNSGNTYTGTTQIFAGSTLKLTDYASIGSSAAIVLHDSTATLDLGTLVTPTLNLSATQSLIGCGSVQGNVSTGSASNLIAPSSGKTINADLSTLDYVNLPGGTMAIGGNLSLFGEETLQFKLKSSTTDPNNDKISVGGAVELTGYSLTKVSIIPDTTLTLDATYTVLTSANDWTDYGLGGGFEWDSANNKTRYTFSVDTTSVPRSLLVKVESDDHATLTWSGATNAVWDVIATANWTGGPVDSQFYQADAVNFTDASNVLTVLLGDATNPALCPASITVNSSKDYTFTTDTTHSGWISGGTGIEKSGTGTLTLGGANDFNGTVNITGGTLKIGSTKALGSIEGGTVVNGGTLDLNGYYNLRREPISVQGAGVGGNGALVNNRANQTSGVAPHQYYVTLTGDATLGGSEFWIIQGTTLQGSGWTPGYLHGNNHALTKKGSCEIDLVDLGETNLGNIDIQAGSLWFLGNTTMGNTAATVNISNGATLTLQDSTVVHAKPIVVDATGGVIFDYSGSGAISGGITLYGTAVITTALDNTLTLSGQIIGTGGLTKINYDAAGGKLVLAGANTYEGPTLISAGTLELAETGQISVLSAITNDAVFQVAEGDHTVGTITGTGTTNVLDAATLTATSITQDSLVIGGAGGAVATMAVPEPGTWMLLFVGLLGMAGWGTIRLRSIDRHGAE